LSGTGLDQGNVRAELLYNVSYKNQEDKIKVAKVVADNQEKFNFEQHPEVKTNLVTFANLPEKLDMTMHYQLILTPQDPDESFLVHPGTPMQFATRALVYDVDNYYVESS
jgi:hypothetical protein